MPKPIRPIDRDTFRHWLSRKVIRPASLEDVWGTHHDRPIWAHPVTGQPFVAVADANEAAVH